MGEGNHGVLHGIRVIDLGRFQAGPRCALMLARMGAEVIKVERIGGEEARDQPPRVRGSSVYWVQYNSGKKSLAINLRREKGKEVLRRLVKVSDILVQNFQPGVIDEMGFGYEVLKSLNRRIVMVNVSGYGQYGPYKDRPGFEAVGQAMSGLMSMTGFPDTPPVMTASSIIDRITALQGCIGALGALWEASKSGEGQAVDVCLADSGYGTTEIPIATFLENGCVPARTGNRLSAFPCNSYQAIDGWVFILAPSENTFSRCAELVGHPEWSSDPTYTDPVARWGHEPEIEGTINRWVAERTVAQVVAEGSKAQVPVAAINDIPTAASDPHLWERELLVPVPDPKAGTMFVAGKLIKFSRSAVPVGPVPAPGEHNFEILSELLGYSDGEIDQIKAEGVI